MSDSIATDVAINKNGCDITLDLGGNTLTGKITLWSGNLTIKNGIVSLPGGYPLTVYADQNDDSDVSTKLTVAADATVEGRYSVNLICTMILAMLTMHRLTFMGLLKRTCPRFLFPVISVKATAL